MKLLLAKEETATCSFRNFVSQLDSFTENGTYFTAENLNKPSDDIPAFSVFHLNVRSLNKHANELVSLLSSIKISFDIICLTEVHNTNLDHFSSLLNGYVYHPVPSLRGNVGGVCVYVKADIKFEVLHDLTFICQSPCENLWFTVSRDKVETIIGLIYRHPDGSIKDLHQIRIHQIRENRKKFEKTGNDPMLNPSGINW